MKTLKEVKFNHFFTNIFSLFKIGIKKIGVQCELYNVVVYQFKKKLYKNIEFTMSDHYFREVIFSSVY
jgi:hypothetical protein